MEIVVAFQRCVHSGRQWSVQTSMVMKWLELIAYEANSEYSNNE